MTAPIRFNQKPVRAISKIVTRLVPKMIAFGGVPAGSIKAIDADNVAGSINNNGCVCVAIAIPDNTGNIISVVAVLDVNSVRNVTKRLIINIITIGCKTESPANCPPSHNDNPESLNPLASAKPPPKSKIMSQGK